MPRKAIFLATCLLASFASSRALGSETTSFLYDELGRLTSLSVSGSVNNGQTATVTFDAAGNRTYYSVSGAGPTSSQFAISPTVATEGVGLIFLVTRVGGVAQAASVNFASTTNGTATAGSDFVAATGMLSFASGESNKQILIQTINDSVVEVNETVNIVLSSPSSGSSISTGSADGVIQDND